MRQFVIRALLLVLIISVGFFLCPKPAMTGSDAVVILFLKGEVEVKTPGKEWVKAYTGMSLSSGDTIKTGRGSWAELTFGDSLANLVKISANTELSLEQVFPIQRLNLMEGEIKALVEKLDKGSTFEVRTPTAVCGVRGSGLGVKTDGTSTTTSAYESNAFVKWVDANGRVISEEIIIEEGLKVFIEKFGKPLKFVRLTAREKKDWNAWRKSIEDRLAGAINSGDANKLKKLLAILELFEKTVEVREKILEKQDTDKIESQKQKKGGSGSDDNYPGDREIKY